jgi:hypothetical protein
MHNKEVVILLSSIYSQYSYRMRRVLLVAGTFRLKRRKYVWTDISMNIWEHITPVLLKNDQARSW